MKQGFPHGSLVKNLPVNAKDAGSIPGSGRTIGEGNGNSLQYSCLGNPVDRGTWRTTVHGVAKESDMTGRLNTTTTNNWPTIDMDWSPPGSSVHGILYHWASREDHLSRLNGINKDVDIENGLVGAGRGKERLGQIERGSLTYTYPTMCEIDSWWEAPVEHRELSLVFNGNLDRWGWG